jgi:hypothetical protein
MSLVRVSPSLNGEERTAPHSAGAHAANGVDEQTMMTYLMCLRTAEKVRRSELLARRVALLTVVCTARRCALSFVQERLDTEAVVVVADPQQATSPTAAGVASAPAVPEPPAAEDQASASAAPAAPAGPSLDEILRRKHVEDMVKVRQCGRLAVARR